ncbi:MAG: redoxin domain-containing protein [Bacteroidota bacterium]
MKIRIPFFVTFAFILAASSEASSQTQKVPPFQMMLHDGKVFRAQNLPLGKHIIIVYFSPECEECHEFIKAMKERIEDLQSASIAMITYMPVEKVKPYVAENKLNIYPNMYVGTESNSLFVANYFSIKLFPFVALFDKNGTLVKKYTSKEVNIDDLINRLQGL